MTKSVTPDLANFQPALTPETPPPIMIAVCRLPVGGGMSVSAIGCRTRCPIPLGSPTVSPGISKVDGLGEEGDEHLGKNGIPNPKRQYWRKRRREIGRIIYYNPVFIAPMTPSPPDDKKAELVSRGY